MEKEKKNYQKLLDFILANNTYFILLLLFIICSAASEYFLTMAVCGNRDCLYRYAVCDSDRGH